MGGIVLVAYVWVAKSDSRHLSDIYDLKNIYVEKKEVENKTYVLN